MGSIALQYVFHFRGFLSKTDNKILCSPQITATVVFSLENGEVFWKWQN